MIGVVRTDRLMCRFSCLKCHCDNLTPSPWCILAYYYYYYLYIDLHLYSSLLILWNGVTYCVTFVVSVAHNFLPICRPDRYFTIVRSLDVRIMIWIPAVEQSSTSFQATRLYKWKPMKQCRMRVMPRGQLCSIQLNGFNSMASANGSVCTLSNQRIVAVNFIATRV